MPILFIWAVKTHSPAAAVPTSPSTCCRANICFAVIRHAMATWDDLPTSYREHHYMCLDPFVLSKEVAALAKSKPAHTIGEDKGCPQETDVMDMSSDAKATNEDFASRLFCVQRSFREELKELLEMSYLCPDVTFLEEQTQLLQGLLCEWKAHVPMLRFLAYSITCVIGSREPYAVIAGPLSTC